MGDYIGEYFRGLLRGILGVQTIAHMGLTANVSLIFLVHPRIDMYDVGSLVQAIGEFPYIRGSDIYPNVSNGK